MIDYGAEVLSDQTIENLLEAHSHPECCLPRGADSFLKAPSSKARQAPVLPGQGSRGMLGDEISAGSHPKPQSWQDSR